MGDSGNPPRLLDRLLAPDAGPWRAMFEVAPMGGALVGADGTLLLANAELAAMAGTAKPQHLVGLKLTQLFTARSGPEITAALARVVAPRDAAAPPTAPLTPLIADLPPTPAAEEGIAAMLAFSPVVEADGSVSGAVLRAIDVTPQRRLEQQLAQAQKMQAVGQLAGGIAHDFNNLLTAILATVDEALPHAQQGGLDGAALRADLSVIRNSAERGAALVKKLLAFGRKQTMQPKVLLLNDAVEDLSNLLRRVLGARVRLVLDLDPPRRLVRVDPTQFDQVVMNLAVNARDAMPKGGTLTLRTGQVNLFRPLTRGRETIPPGRYAMLEVEDTGTGIPPDYLERIFEPFFSTKRESGGTGLGLATVWGIVRQMDGFVAVDSTPGDGSVFRVYLPRYEPFAEPEPTAPVDAPAAAAPSAPPQAAPPQAAPPPQPTPPEAASRGQVLLADDEDTIRRLAARALARAGWEVLEAATGDAAIALIEGMAEPPTLLITDVVMPGADGPAVVRAARARFPDLQVMVTSGYAESLAGDDLAREKVHWMAKPYAMKDLVAEAARLVAKG
jgi:two-component system, cell cycle sensor histidine kinase and response regulator CckA